MCLPVLPVTIYVFCKMEIIKRLGHLEILVNDENDISFDNVKENMVRFIGSSLIP